MHVLARQPVAAKGRERLFLHISVCFASLVGLQILDLGLNTPITKVVLALVVVAGLVFAYFLEERFRPFVRIAVDLLGLAFVVYYIWRMVEDFLSAGNYLGTLLGILLALLAFITFDLRVHRQMLVISVVFIIFSATTSYDLLMMFYVPLFLIFGGAGFYFINALDLGSRVVHVGRDDRLRPELVPRFAVAVGSFIIKMVLAIVAVSVVVYVLIPHYMDINRPALFIPQVSTLERDMEDLRVKRNSDPLALGPGELAISGFSGTFDLAYNRSVFGSTTLYFSSEPAIEVRSTSGGYLRGAVFDLYTGQAWEPSPEVNAHLRAARAGSRSYQYVAYYTLPLIDFPSQEYAETELVKRGISVEEKNVYSRNEDSDLNYNIFTQEVLFLKDHPNVFFSSYQPVRLEELTVVRTPEGDAYDPNPLIDDFAIPRSQLPRHPRQFSYRATVLAPVVRRSQMERSFGDAPSEILARYTQLPVVDNEIELEAMVGHDVVPVPQRVLDAAHSVIADATTQHEKVRLIYNYLKNPTEFRYNTEFEALGDYTEATDHFLFDSRSGFCQQFASAMAVMCRANGIPARVVTGYAPGGYSIVGNKYVYRDRNAHAWVEVYFDGLGWVLFDPTQASSDIFSFGRFREFVRDTSTFLENLFVIDPAGAKETIAAFFVGLYNLAVPFVVANWQWAPLAIGVFIAAAIGISLLRRRARKARELVPENEIVAAYIELSNLLRASSLGRQPYDTSKEFKRRLSDFLIASPEDLSRFITLYEIAAFSRRPLSSEDVSWSREFLAHVREYVERSKGGLASS